MKMLNSTIIHRNNDVYYNVDSFPLSYEEDNFDSSSILLNHSYYDDILLNLNHTLNKTNSLSILSLSSPLTYIIFIIISYLILTIILLTFSLYKQRRNEIENFYFGDTDEDIAQEKRYLAWKQLLIGKIKKGDMEPLLSDENDQQQISTGTFPLHIV
ncbi:unnamed protein product [Rotaria sordida]|uniref:Uncharacterized protein n=1 Tax=Rotaria sordida TaxID=392033 RepID=A0A813QN33_9BILA|nr:unnamed protein product [Rotaria sordida]CAF1296050.1 unnamed protein product [Rotaria sordida]